jgi:hypothetical protein
LTNGPLSAIEPLFPAKPLSLEILPCSVLSPIDHLFPVKHFITLIVLMGGPMAPIEPLFPIQPLSSENLPCSVLMDVPLLPI